MNSIHTISPLNATALNSDRDNSGYLRYRDYPGRTQFVRSGVNSRCELWKFLSTEVERAEVDARFDRVNDTLILRRDSYEKRPFSASEDTMTFDECLEKLVMNDKKIRINLREGGVVIDRVLRKLGQFNIKGSDLWFNASIDNLTGHEFINMADRFPEAVIHCKIDLLVPVISEDPARARGILSLISSWGVKRFSLNWKCAGSEDLLNFMSDNGYDVDYYDIFDKEDLKRAIHLMPGSVTFKFDLNTSFIA